MATRKRRTENLQLPRHGKTPIGAFYSPGIFNDGGGIIIYPGHDGKIHVKRIPPRAPVLQGLSLVANLVAAQEKSKRPGASKEISMLAEQFGADALAAIAKLVET